MKNRETVIVVIICIIILAEQIIYSYLSDTPDLDIKLSNLVDRTHKIESENLILQVEVLHYSSLNYIEQKAKNMGFVDNTQNIIYLY